MYRKRIYFNLLQTQVHLLYGCTFFFLLALGVFWWFFLYNPIRAANFALENDLAITYKRLQSQKIAVKNAENLNKRFSDLKTSMSGSANKKDSALCSLVSIAQKNNLLVSSARLCRQKNKQWCALQEIQAECRGTYDQLVSFFEQLAQHKPIINCKTCEITRNEKTLLTARATFYVYLIT